MAIADLLSRCASLLPKAAVAEGVLPSRKVEAGMATPNPDHHQTQAFSHNQEMQLALRRQARCTLSAAQASFVSQYSSMVHSEWYQTDPDFSSGRRRCSPQCSVKRETALRLISSRFMASRSNLADLERPVVAQCFSIALVPDVAQGVQRGLVPL